MLSAVWLVRSHQIAAELRYWLTFIGYDKRDHSLSHKIYLGYASLFFIAWGFATLALLATFAGVILKALAGGLVVGLNPADALALLKADTTLPYTAAALMALVMLGWWLYTSYNAGRASPMTFSEDDAALICQTPVSRPAVALLWLLGEWIKSGPFFWALAVTLAFALQDASLGKAVSVEYVPHYVVAGLRALSLVLFLQWGLMALSWAWGVLRLQRDRVRRYWWLGPVVLGLALLLALFQSGGLLAGMFQGVGGLAIFPLSFPLSAGYGLASWPGGLAASLAWGILGSLALGFAARPLNLGRAAQESTGRSASEAAAQAGNAQAAAEIALRRRLGTGHAPTRLPVQANRWALIWKNGLAWDRRGGFAALGSMIVMLVSGIGIALAPDWGTRVWAVLAWLVAVEQFTSGPLVDDLRMWPLLRGLPIATRDMLLSELALPSLVVILLGVIAAVAAAPLSAATGGLPVWVVLLLPGAVVSCGLAAVMDVVRSSRSSRLMVGQAPLPGTLGVIVGGLALGLSALMAQMGGGGAFGYLMGGIIAAAAAWLLLWIASDGVKNIE
jgi:hypothetical protein